MNILFITSYFPPIAGGSSVVYENICKNLSENVFVLTTWRHYMDGKNINGYHELDKNFPFFVKRIELLRPVIHSSPANFLVSINRLFFEDIPLKMKIARTVLRMIDENKIDIVCLGELYALSWIGKYVKRKRGLPVIHYIHGEEITTPSGSRFYGRNAIKELSEADAVIAVSNFTKKELIKRQISENKIHLISNGVDTSFFYPGTKNSDIIKKQKIENKKILLTIARVEERKGHDKVIEALPDILKKHSDIVYLIVGEGSYLSHLQELVKNRKLQGHVIFTGKVDLSLLVFYYQSCDIFVMPNRTLPNGDTEGFGLVFLEAGACAKPVIGGKAGGVPDAVADGETGILVDGNSVQQISNAILELIEDPSYAEFLGKKGRKRAEKFSWARKAEEFRQICSLLMRENGSN